MENNNSTVCSVCHQNILPEYYFCPNCGANLKQAPLPTDLQSQVSLYVFSVILPMIAFLFISKWKGLKYFKSKDPEEKKIGQIALLLIVFSTVFTVWYAIVWTQSYVKSQVDIINSDLSSYGL